ncbi:3-dehydroquinate synthase [Streptomyces sp. Ru71]|uniref:3-dehydroquinate synthase n=1 Tax=Streptomyces sp. Ru71 TaxID=2080746 RepID=UPI000CDD8606|nr:3-dehydroquinate synthase [Streptomyces sp. Ru71]POX56980.1 3-dehydroquinate synthase [Streptomyces sp. Ru71]
MSASLTHRPVTRVTVRHAPQPYDVVVGTGVAQRELDALLGDPVLRVGLIHPHAMSGEALRTAEALSDAGRVVTLIPVPDGEQAKDLRVAAGIWDTLARAGFTRTDAVVGLGGGATTDLAGYVAANWLRGVRLVLVPTTLLAMVDAAVGGKTAVNLPSGKNLVGAFHSPAGVLCDTDRLATLDPAELVSGTAEILKAGFIADTGILDLVAVDPRGATDPDAPVVRELIERAVRVKADVVAGDPLEHGAREYLNYGHTLGHAIERAEGYRVRHGEAVAVGMVYAAELARLSGRLTHADVERHRHLLSAVGLPTTWPSAAWPELRQAFGVDKKARGRRLRFVVLDAIGSPAILDSPDEALLEAAYAKVGRP